MESEIRDATHKAEDIIESHMVDQMLSEPEAKSFTISPPDLQPVIQEFDAAMDKLMTLMTHGSPGRMPSYTLLPGLDSASLLTAEPDHPISSKDAVVGLDDDMLHLADLLTGDEGKLRIIPIIGMGGIGKTTLARELYNDGLTVSHFDARAWTTISQVHNVKAILLGLLRCIIGKLPDEILKEENRELGVRLYKSLFGYRYLIVLDDMWSTNAWDEIKWLFPNENNGSRIMVTTREMEVAKHVDPSKCPWHHKVHLLSESQSWNLLQHKVFGKDKCPTELEVIGKNIAANCRGLPLAIHVIGGLLPKEKGTIGFWEQIEADVKVALSEKDDQVFNVLSLSYNYLPHYLKACFLYMAAFPEDYNIQASRLIRLWVAEGFLRSNGRRNLEEEAEGCLNALADRNLVTITEHKSNGKAKSYSIHDLLRELCIRKAEREKFLYVLPRQGHNTVPADSSHRLRRVSIASWIYADEEFVHPAAEFMLLARSFLCIGELVPCTGPFSVIFELRLLRELDMIDLEFYEFPKGVLQLVNLRYFAITLHEDVPATICRLCNLQTFILGFGPGCLVPIEILEMPELRHLKCEADGYLFMWRDSVQINFVNEKLRTLAITYLYPNLLESIPNIKKLGISFPTSTDEVDLHHLNKLEILRLSPDDDGLYLPPIRFPGSLRKLKLRLCTIPLGFMTLVASSLPNLEVLKISSCHFEIQTQDDEEEEWDPIEEEKQDEEEEEVWDSTKEEFSSLRYLLLEYPMRLHSWPFETNFPSLQHLVVRGCYDLEEIPEDIGDIPTLKLIQVNISGPGVADSARKIKEKQHELGNDDIEVRILFGQG